MKLWVDDLRPAPDGWAWARTSQEAITIIKDWWNEVEIISLDHDLGGNDTGYKVLIFIEYAVAIEGYPFTPEIRIHTSNPAGREKMEAAVTSIIAFDRQNRMG
jgi:hypothetical protein